MRALNKSITVKSWSRVHCQSHMKTKDFGESNATSEYKITNLKHIDTARQYSCTQPISFPSINCFTTFMVKTKFLNQTRRGLVLQLGDVWGSPKALRTCNSKGLKYIYPQISIDDYWALYWALYPSQTPFFQVGLLLIFTGPSDFLFSV